MKTVLFKIIQIVYYIMFSIGILTCTVWYLDKKVVIELPQGFIIKKEVKRGQIVTFIQPVNKLRMCEGHVTRWIEGECGKYEVHTVPATQHLGYKEITISFEVPKSASIGQCALYSYHVYHCNPIDILTDRNSYTSYPIEFIVK